MFIDRGLFVCVQPDHVTVQSWCLCNPDLPSNLFLLRRYVSAHEIIYLVTGMFFGRSCMYLESRMDMLD